MPAALPALRALLLTAWVGSMWTIGFLVAPTLFGMLDDRTLAGRIAGRLFHVEAWLGLACGVLLLALARIDAQWVARRTAAKLVLAMLACVLVGYFGLQPSMEALKQSAAAAGGVMDDATRAQFGMLHGVSSVIYLVQSLLALWLVLKSR